MRNIEGLSFVRGAEPLWRDKKVHAVGRAKNHTTNKPRKGP